MLQDATCISALDFTTLAQLISNCVFRLRQCLQPGDKGPTKCLHTSNDGFSGRFSQSIPFNPLKSPILKSEYPLNHRFESHFFYKQNHHDSSEGEQWGRYNLPRWLSPIPLIPLNQSLKKSWPQPGVRPVIHPRMDNRIFHGPSGSQPCQNFPQSLPWKSSLVGGATKPSWKMMEFFNGKDDIPYMKWKIWTSL